MHRFTDINLVRQELKGHMDLDQFISLADKRYTTETGKKCDPLECVNDHLYKKRCDLDEHPVDPDGTRDSTASFTVCPPKELWHCFGCGASGDRFEYISRKFHVDHMDSIRITAEIQGFDLSPYYEDVSAEEQIKINLFMENDQARDIAHQALLNSPKAMDYLKGRGMSEEVIRLFKLGYAPPLTDGRVEIFESIGNSIVLQLNRKDQFNDAILFPITDVSGRMRYFQSRPFNPITGMKYIGGNDSHPLFDGTDRIFGFNVSKRELYKNGGRLVGVEGAPDCIACIQHGVPACGFLGTVVNQMTFDLLDKYRVVELVLLLDGDKAGRDRSFKISEKYLGLQTNVRLKVAMLPDGYDPDEFINKFGVDELNAIIDSAPYAVQYLIDQKWNGAITPTDKMAFMYSVQNYINAISDHMVKTIMINYIASKMGLDPVQIEDYYTRTAVNTAGAKLYSPDGEEILLGEAIRSPEFIAELADRFRDDDWYFLRHKHLFRILKSAEYTDVESLYTIAKNMSVDNIITYEWLESLYNKHGNVDFSLKDVEDKLMRRRALDILDKTRVLANDMGHDVAIALDKATTDIYGTIHRKTDEQIFNAHQQVNSVMRLIHERMQNPNDIIGYSLGDGFPKVTRALLGVQTKTLTVVAANQSVGKTQICENWAMYQAISCGIPTLWFSLEMDKDRMTFRNLSILSGVQCTELMTGNITMEQKAIVDNAAIMLDSAPFHLSERGHDLSEALAISRRYVMKYGVKVIYVDYCQLQYVSDRKTDARHRELGWISKGWKEFAKEMDVAVILISQLSKTALQAETAEAEHGAGSYEIAQDADNYITLKEKSEDEINQRGIEHGNITLNISKNRMGEKSILIDVYADRPVHRMMEC